MAYRYIIFLHDREKFGLNLTLFFLVKITVKNTYYLGTILRKRRFYVLLSHEWEKNAYYLNKLLSLRWRKFNKYYNFYAAYECNRKHHVE